MSDALIHLRIPAETKVRWVRESRNEGKRLTYWIIEKIEGTKMHTMYIYRTEDNVVVARIHGETNEAIEAKADDLNYMGSDDFGATYTPAFGVVDGLIDSDKAVDYNA